MTCIYDNQDQINKTQKVEIAQAFIINAIKESGAMNYDSLCSHCFGPGDWFGDADFDKALADLVASGSVIVDGTTYSLAQDRPLVADVVALKHDYYVMEEMELADSCGDAIAAAIGEDDVDMMNLTLLTAAKFADHYVATCTYNGITYTIKVGSDSFDDATVI